MSALLRLAPTAQQQRRGAAELCKAVLGMLRQLAGQGGDTAALAVDAMLQLVLAAAKGESVQVRHLPYSWLDSLRMR